MWAEQSAEGGSVILTGARRGFFYKSEDHGFHSLQEYSTTAPSRVQFMPTAHNITAFLARIHTLNICS